MEGRKVISGKMLAAIAGILLLVMGITAFWQGKEKTEDGTTLTICQDGQPVYSCSLQELMAMESVQVPVKMQSSSKKTEQGRYQGVWLDTLLEQAGAKAEGTVVLTAGDGYSSAASGEEAGFILIAYGVDGDTLGYYEKGGTGPIRAVFTGDVYGNRSVQYLTRIDVKS